MVRTTTKLLNIIYFYPSEAKYLLRCIEVVPKNNRFHTKSINRSKQVELIEKLVDDCIGRKDKKLEMSIFRLIEEFRTSLNDNQYAKNANSRFGYLTKRSTKE